MSADERDVLTRPAPPPDAVLRYGGHPDQVIDLRLPPDPHAAHPAPLAVVVHGGFWRQQWDRSHVGPLSVGLAAAGYAVATVEYRRGGLVAVEDVASAIEAAPALVADVAPRPVDSARSVLVGHSAGGHLVLWAAARPGADAPSGVVALAAVSDLVAAERDDLDDGAIRDLLGGPAAAAAHLDPARLPAPDAPTVLVHGAEDPQVPVTQSRHYAATHSGVGYDELPGCGHFALIDPRSPAWPRVLAAVRRVTPPLTTLP